MGTLHTNVEFKWNIFHYWDTYIYTRDFTKLQWRGKLHVHHMCSHAHRLQFIQDCDFLFPFFKGEYMTWQCTPVIINSVSLQLVFAVICHFHIAHDASCLIRPRSCPPPPPKKKEEKKKTICIRITFNFTWVLTTFTKTIMHLVYSPKFALPLPERNWKQSLYITHLFIYCTFLGGRGNKQGALWSMCKWRITAKTILMHFFFWGGGGVKQGRIMQGQCESGE